MIEEDECRKELVDRVFEKFTKPKRVVCEIDLISDDEDDDGGVKSDCSSVDTWRKEDRISKPLSDKETKTKEEDLMNWIPESTSKTVESGVDENASANIPAIENNQDVQQATKPPPAIDALKNCVMLNNEEQAILDNLMQTEAMTHFIEAIFILVSIHKAYKTQAEHFKTVSGYIYNFAHRIEANTFKRKKEYYVEIIAASMDHIYLKLEALPENLKMVFVPAAYNKLEKLCKQVQISCDLEDALLIEKCLVDYKEHLMNSLSKGNLFQKLHDFMAKKRQSVITNNVPPQNQNPPAYPPQIQHNNQQFQVMYSHPNQSGQIPFTIHHHPNQPQQMPQNYRLQLPHMPNIPHSSHSMPSQHAPNSLQYQQLMRFGTPPDMSRLGPFPGQINIDPRWVQRPGAPLQNSNQIPTNFMGSPQVNRRSPPTKRTPHPNQYLPYPKSNPGSHPISSTTEQSTDTQTSPSLQKSFVCVLCCNKATLYCEGCYCFSYCSVDCQNAHDAEHKKMCASPMYAVV